MSDGYSAVKVDDNMPPSTGHKDSLTRPLEDFNLSGREGGRGGEWEGGEEGERERGIMRYT